MAGGLVRAHGVFHLLKKILLQDVRFQRGAGFAGHNYKRFLQVQLAANRLHLRRIGRVHNVQCGKARLLPEGLGQHLGAEAGTAHAQEKNRLETASLHVRGQLGKVRQLPLLPLDNVDPAHPVFLAVAGP